jgi:membrane-bound metal-dependent hydrolase YbcI (DUF457 family)
MNLEAHLAAGWILAHCGGPSTRRFRAAVTFAAIAPDLDVLSYLGGARTYSTLHHALGHNIFFGLLVSLASLAFFTRADWWKVFLFTQLAFASHYYGDYFFTRFPLEPWWPFSTKGYIHSYRIGLDHPINLFLSYFSFVVFIVLGVLFKRTPIELISPELDRRIVNLFRRRTMACHICERGANEMCSVCGNPVCMKHGRIARGFRVRCARCAEALVPVSETN